MSRGVVYIAYGPSARKEVKASVASLKKHNDLPVLVLSDQDIKGVPTQRGLEFDPSGRMTKTSMQVFSPFTQTLYLDADTRVRGDLTPGFEILDDGWDIALAFSERQGDDVLGNCYPDDRLTTFEALGCSEVLGLQAGVMFLDSNERVHRFFQEWYREWSQFKSMDQAALLRALWTAPLRVWLLGRAWNGGNLVEHLFGRARR
jgi:hypothetical protein